MIALFMSTDWGKKNPNLACGLGLLGDICLGITFVSMLS